MLVNPADPEDFISYKVKHDNNGARYTGEVCSNNYNRSLHFYGCSVTWGHGVSDSSTFPYKVQSMLDDAICVKNYGVGAYSTLQAYMLFEQNLAKGDTPTIATLDYGSFQDYRNSMTYSWRNAWYIMLHQANKDSIDLNFPNFALPYATIEHDQLSIQYYTQTDMIIPKWRRYSAILDRIYIMVQQRKKADKNSIEISKLIIKRMKERCDQLDIDFILCAIYSDENTQSMIRYFSDIGYNAVDISVDQSKNEYNLMPYDNHLNDKANAILAEKFVSYFSKTNFH